MKLGDAITKISIKDVNIKNLTIKNPGRNVASTLLKDCVSAQKTNSVATVEPVMLTPLPYSVNLSPMFIKRNPFTK